MASGVPEPTTHANEDTGKDNPDISIWLSDDSEDEREKDFNNILMEQLFGWDTDSSSSDDESPRKPVPSWKNSESYIDMKKLFTKLNNEDQWLNNLREKDEEPGIVDDGDDETLTWTHNFSTFTGTPLPFTGNPGPTMTSTDPYTIFTSIWNKEIMGLIAEETNRYAKHMYESQRNKEKPAKHVTVKWTNTTVDELYVYFSLLIFVSLHKLRIEELIFGGTKLTIPFFPKIMNVERFESLTRCLHFVDNTKLQETNKAMAKIKPITDHCNAKFTSLYRPRQFLHVDDSLLLSKDGSAPGIRVQASNFGLRTYELSEVFTGYLLKVLQYPGSDDGMPSKAKAEIVLDLVSEYAGKGHRIVSDKYFSSVYLARTLKSKGFDAILEVRKTRKDLPESIQQLKEDVRDPELYKYKGNKVRVVSRHCGDVTCVAWSKWDITAISTFHDASMRPNKKGVRRPALTLDYYKVREKISEKDEDLTEYVMMMKDSERWYIKMFKILLNISVRNCYIIYRCNKRNIQCLSQIRFRHMLANQLLDEHGIQELVEKARMLSLEENDSDDDCLCSMSDLDSDDEDSNDCNVM